MQLRDWRRSVVTQSKSFFDPKRNRTNIEQFFGIHDLKPIGELTATMVGAIGGILEYMRITQKQALPMIGMPTPKQIICYNELNIIPVSYF